MVNINEKIQTQKDKIKKGGWKKWGAYLALAAFICMGLSITLFQQYFLRKKLAKAKTDAAIAEEALVQDEVDDKIRDLDKENEEADEAIEDLSKWLDEVKNKDEESVVKHDRRKKAIISLKDWDDIDTNVKWKDDE